MFYKMTFTAFALLFTSFAMADRSAVTGETSTVCVVGSADGHLKLNQALLDDVVVVLKDRKKITFNDYSAIQVFEKNGGSQLCALIKQNS